MTVDEALAFAVGPTLSAFNARNCTDDALATLAAEVRRQQSLIRDLLSLAKITGEMVDTDKLLKELAKR